MKSLLTRLESYEEFSEEQTALLSQFVTNVSSNVFALHNLPEVIKGALFSRYSRSDLGLRSLLLKEFICADPATSGITAHTGSHDQLLAIKKAQNFYDRILDSYGDDSVGELGGSHLAAENISMLAAKIIEDRRIGGSPLEKSTRYIYFDTQIDGQYRFYREPILEAAGLGDLYTQTCNQLFETYKSLKEQLIKKIETEHPCPNDQNITAYKTALRAKVCDCLRGLLPASALTNVGIFGNGRFYENLIRTLNTHSLHEIQDIGNKALEELSKVIPSFVRRADPEHPHHAAFDTFHKKMHEKILEQHATYLPSAEKQAGSPGVSLLDYDSDAPAKVAAAMLFSSSHNSLEELQALCKQLPESEISSILDAGAFARENRRHKSPRALEHAEFTFEIVADFGCYRDLQRHRILTQERQLLTCQHGYYIPPELEGSEMKEIYCSALENAKEAFDQICSRSGLFEEAQYIVPMAYNIRWYFRVNLRALQWICELRSAPQGHPTYRFIAQEMAKQVVQKFPCFERFFKFVDFDGYELGRFGQEVRAELKKAKRE